MAKVSVLMPVYNGEKYLAQAIESIGFQSYDDWELIIVDDGSTDMTAEIVSRYRDNRIYYLKNERNIGLIATLNKGIDYCSGKYIARMDADDISEPERLKKQIEFMESHPNYVMCGTNARIINSEGNPIGSIKNLTTNNYLRINLLFSVPFVHPSMIIRKEAILNSRYDADFKHVEDYDLWCRLSAKGMIANVGKKFLQYRWHESNISVVNSAFQEAQKDKIIRRELALLELNPTEEELWCHRITFRLYSFGIKQSVSVEKITSIENWFHKLIEQNKKKKIYQRTSFTAYVWSRWCVLCFVQKKYAKAFFPSFANYNPVIVVKLLRLLFKLMSK